MGLQTTPLRAVPYRADNGNLGTLGVAYRHGTVLAPKQYLYEKKATGVRSPKI